MTAAPTTPALEVPAGLVVGSRVKARTNVGEKEGTITNIRYDSQRRAHRYSVPDDAGNTFEYSESLLTLIAGGENSSGAKFKIGDQVRTSGGRTVTVTYLEDRLGSRSPSQPFLMRNSMQEIDRPLV